MPTVQLVELHICPCLYFSMDLYDPVTMTFELLSLQHLN